MVPHVTAPDPGRPRLPTAFQAAHLHLRGPSGPLSTCLRWPAPTRRPPGLLVFLGGAGGDAPPLGPDLGRRAGLVLVALAPGTVDDAVAVTQWAADHGAELGADAGRLVVGGVGRGAGGAAAVAARARDEGWPPLAAQVLVRPDGPPATAGAGLAPAVIVAAAGPGAGRAGAGREPGRVAADHAARLRAAGVATELVDGPPVVDGGAALVTAVVAALGRLLAGGEAVA
jgi:hypothetical protein